jgi:hypothetical protein
MMGDRVIIVFLESLSGGKACGDSNSDPEKHDIRFAKFDPMTKTASLILTVLLLAPLAALHAAGPDYQSKHLALGLSPTRPAFSWFAVDSLGKGKLDQNPVLAETDAIAGLELDGQTYRLNGKPVWHVTWSERTLLLRSEHADGAPPFTLRFNQKANHATLLGMMQPGERRMALPCVLHLPDMGTLRVTGNTPGAKLDYEARRRVQPGPFVLIEFPPATAEQKQIEYELDVTLIHPALPGIENNPLYDGFRRDFLNIFQINPRGQMLANNASSDPVTFSVFTYAEVARVAPPLVDGMTCLDLVRMTLDRYLSGAKGYGQVGYGPGPGDMEVAEWSTPWDSLDAHPSLLIAACIYAESMPDLPWARANYGKLLALAREMMARDHDGNGLIEYEATGNYGDRPLRTKRPSNWWDTINFGHEDAYANALAYRACRQFAELARQLEHADDAREFADKAAKLRAAYVPTFLNPATGVLAGWKSKDGQLHDYWFTFVQGVAITAGLLDDATANAVMDKLLAKMQEVGYTHFNLGLPGNLVPIRKGDYVHHNTPPEQFGEPQLEDGSDGFQFYENGGATGCWAYYTIKALYQLGRVEDARRIFHPMLAGYARGEFQGFCENGKSRDWRDWKGGCHGYEGMLVENYHALLAVLDDVEAKP